MLARLLPGAPATVWKIIFMEGMERFSYYGFRAILTLFFVRRLGMEESRAVSYFAFTSALAYASPLLGAWLADERWGRFATIYYMMKGLNTIHIGIIEGIMPLVIAVSAPAWASPQGSPTAPRSAHG